MGCAGPSGTSAQAPQAPVEPAPVEPAPVAAEQSPVAPPTESKPDPDVPVDPSKEMPDQSITTDARLTLDQEANVTIDGRSDIYSSALKAADEERGGKLPSAITLASGTGVIQFPKVVGKAGCQAEAAFGPDGGDCVGGNTDLLAANKYSGIVAHDRTLFLVGVFTGPKMPAKAPATLDFTKGAKGTEFKELAPVLGQVFFIGDGKTGTGTGDLQNFKVPSGATMLYLGYADGYAFQGNPGAYGDNTGGLHVTLVQHGK